MSNSILLYLLLVIPNPQESSNTDPRMIDDDPRMIDKD